MLHKIANGIINHILDTPSVTHTEIEERASTKDWYTQNTFDDVMEIVHKDERVSTSVKDGEVIYKKKVKRIRKESKMLVMPPYPVFESDALLYDKKHPLYDAHVCRCSMFAKPSEWDVHQEHEEFCNKNPKHNIRCLEYEKRNDDTA